jgi:hypothetical protein
LAGVTLAAYAVPVSLAYATLAGLPPQTGIYCYLSRWAVLRTFRHLTSTGCGPDLGDLNACRHDDRRRIKSCENRSQNFNR